MGSGECVGGYIVQYEIMKKFSRKVLTNMEVKAMIWGKLAVANLLFGLWLAIANLSGMIEQDESGGRYEFNNCSGRERVYHRTD